MDRILQKAAAAQPGQFVVALEFQPQRRNAKKSARSFQESQKSWKPHETTRLQNFADFFPENPDSIPPTNIPVPGGRVGHVVQPRPGRSGGQLLGPAAAALFIGGRAGDRATSEDGDFDFCSPGSHWVHQY